jgi:hypothetical protein
MISQTFCHSNSLRPTKIIQLHLDACDSQPIRKATLISGHWQTRVPYYDILVSQTRAPLTDITNLNLKKKECRKSFVCIEIKIVDFFVWEAPLKMLWVRKNIYIRHQIDIYRLY